MSLIDTYYPKKKDEDELLTPSQTAAVEQKKKKSLIDTYYPAKKVEEEVKPEQKTSFLTRAKETVTKVKEAATGLFKGVSEFLKPKPIISPIPEAEIIKPGKLNITPEAQKQMESSYLKFPSIFPHPEYDLEPKVEGQSAQLKPEAKDAINKFWSAPIDNTIEATRNFLDYHPNALNVLAEAQKITEDTPFIGIKANPVTRGIVKGVSETFLGSSKEVRYTFDTRLPQPVTVADKTFQTVGEIVGGILSFVAGGSTLKALGLGKATLPVLFATLGQTSAPLETTIKQRLEKMPVDVVAGWLFSKVPATKGFGGEFLKSMGKVSGIGSGQAFLNSLIEGKDEKEAAQIAATQAVIMALFHISGSAMGLLSNEILNSKVKTGEGIFTGEQIKNIVSDSKLEGTKAGNDLIKLANQADKTNKNVKIDMTAVQKTFVSSKLNLDKPEGLGFNAELIDKAPQTAPVTPEETKPTKMPAVITKEIQKPTGEVKTPIKPVSPTPPSVETTKPTEVKPSAPAVGKGAVTPQWNWQDQRAMGGGEPYVSVMLKEKPIGAIVDSESIEIPKGATGLAAVPEVGKYGVLDSKGNPLGVFNTIEEAEKVLRQYVNDFTKTTTKVSLGKKLTKEIEKQPIVEKPTKEKPTTAEAAKLIEPVEKIKIARKPLSEEKRAAIQKEIQSNLYESPTQEVAVEKINAYITDNIKSKNDKELKAVRAELNRQMFKLAGADTGNWKKDYAIFQDSRKNPEVSNLIDQVESSIDDIDRSLKAGVVTTSSGFADMGGYADTKSIEKKIADIKAIEMPELVKIARLAMGDVPTLKRFRKALGYFYAKDNGAIKLDPEIFKNPDLAAKVMAHEVGHMTDYFEDKTMARGNLVGRIASLNKNLKDAFGDLSNKKMREELKALTQKWKPFDESAVPDSFIKYRYSSKELYADALSVLLNDPEMLKKEAPTFCRGFFDYLNKKPTIEKNLNETWNLLNQGEEELFKARDEEINRSFKKGEDTYIAKEVEKQKRITSLMYMIQTLFDDKNTPVIRKVNEALKNGKYVPANENPEYALHGFNYTDGKLKNYINDNFQPIYQKAQLINDGWNSLGKVLFYERVINERGELANPQGYNPETAQKQLELMKKSMTDREWDIVTQAKEMFREAVKKSVANAEKNKFYTPDLLKQMKMNPAYATYQVIDYLDTYISAHVYQQVGTLKDIANPATSTVMKLISVEKAIERNNVKKLNLEFLKKNFSSEIEDAKTMWNGRSLQSVNPKDPDKGLVIAIEDGRPKGYYVDKNIADTLTYSSNKEIRALAKVSRVLSQSKFYRPLFTSFNLGFQTFNFVRDFNRYWKNMPDRTLGEAITSFPRALLRYTQAAPHAAKRVLNWQDTLIKDMENAKILGLKYSDAFKVEEDEHRQQIERILDKAGVLQKTKRNKLFTPFHLVLDIVEGMGNFIESLPKIAGYIELKGKMPQEEMAEFIRTSIGSPDFRISGTGTPVTNNIFLFSNAIKEGIKSDIKVATGKRGRASQAGFWWKTLIGTYIPKIIMAGIAAGLFGKALKDQMDKATEYDKTNYTVLPLGVDENNKAVYLRIPQDETGRLLGGLLWKSININKDKDLLKSVADIFSFGAGQFPNLSPAWTGADALITYLSGRNPYDSYRGRTIIPDKEFAAGYKYSFPIMLKWLVKNQGLGIFYPTNENYYNEKQTDLQKTLNLPFVSNILGRWIKVTDYGKTEQLKEITQQVGKGHAIELIQEKAKIDKAIKDYQSGTQNMTRRMQIEKQLVRDILGKPPYTGTNKTKETNLKKKFKIGIIRGESDQNVNAIISATSNDQKVTLLKEMNAQMESDEFSKMINTLTKEKIISKDVLKEFKKNKLQGYVPTSEEFKLLDIFKPKEAMAAEGMMSPLGTGEKPNPTPYRLDPSDREGYVKVVYPSGAVSEIKTEDLPKYGALIQENYRMFNKGEYPKTAPNWLATQKESVLPSQKGATRTPFDKEIKEAFGDNWKEATRVLRYTNEAGEVHGENIGFQTGPEIDVANRINPETGKYDKNAPIKQVKNPFTDKQEDSIDRGLFRVNNGTFYSLLNSKDYREQMKEAGIISSSDLDSLDANTASEAWDKMLDPKLNIKMARIIYNFHDDISGNGWSGWFAAPPELLAGR